MIRSGVIDFEIWDKHERQGVEERKACSTFVGDQTTLKELLDLIQVDLRLEKSRIAHHMDFVDGDKQRSRWINKSGFRRFSATGFMRKRVRTYPQTTQHSRVC